MYTNKYLNNYFIIIIIKKQKIINFKNILIYTNKNNIKIYCIKNIQNINNELIISLNNNYNEYII